MMKKFTLAFLAWLGIATAAWADGGAALVSTTPTVPTSGHCAQWGGSNILTDAGMACGSGGGGSGTVTSVGSGTGLLGGPITGAGTLSVNTGVIAALGNANNWTGVQTFTNPIVAPIFTSTVNGIVPFSGGGTAKFLRADGTWATVSGSGTVTSVTCGTGMTGGTITASGTCNVDNSAVGFLAGTQTFSGNKTFTGAIVFSGTATGPVFTTASNGFVPLTGGVSGRFLGDDGAWHAASGIGTVSSVDSTGPGIVVNGGTACTTTCLIGIDTSYLATLHSNLFDGFQNNKITTAASAGSYMQWSPTDFGTGKPALALGKLNSSTPQEWDISCFDGATFTCKVNIQASNFTWNGNPVATTGGSAAFSGATIYDIVNNFAGSAGGSLDNTTPFNNALAACSAGGGGIIWFRAGNFRFNSAINDNVQGCNIVGAGPQATNLIYYGSSGNFISINAYNSGVSNLAIFSGGSWSSGFGIAVGVSAGASLATYNNLYFSGLPGFIYLTGASETKFTNIYGVNPTGAAAYQCDGAGASQVFGTRWNNVAIGYNATNTTTNGFHMGSGCNTWAMSQVSSSGAGAGSGNNCLLVDSGTAFLVLDDFECDHSVSGGTIQGGTGIQIVNSWFGSSLGGNGLTFTSGFSGFASVSNSHIRDNSASGVLVNGSGGVQLTGNIISGNASAQVAVGGGVSNFQINSNSLGVPGDPTSTYCALVNTGASNYYTISNNVCGATNTNGVTDGGSGSKKSVTGNVGP